MYSMYYAVVLVKDELIKDRGMLVFVPCQKDSTFDNLYDACRDHWKSKDIPEISKEDISMIWIFTNTRKSDLEEIEMRFCDSHNFDVKFKSIAHQWVCQSRGMIGRR